jgi:hypothetical protein
MNVADITAKAKVLLEALPYIQDFRGSTFVVKYGGSFMDDPDPLIRTRVAYDIAFFAACGINVVVVHGGGKAITRAMESSGLKASFRERHAGDRRSHGGDRQAHAGRHGQPGRLRRDRHRQRETQGPARRHRAGLPEDSRLDDEGRAGGLWALSAR